MNQNNLKNRAISMKQMANYKYKNRLANFEDSPNYLGYGAAGAGAVGLGAGGVAAYQNRDNLLRNANTMRVRAQDSASRAAQGVRSQAEVYGRKANNQAQRSGNAINAQKVRAGNKLNEIGTGMNRDVRSIGRGYNENLKKADRVGSGASRRLARGSRAGSALSSAGRFLTNTNTGRVGLGLGVLGAGAAGYRAMNRD